MILNVGLLDVRSYRIVYHEIINFTGDIKALHDFGYKTFILTYKKSIVTNQVKYAFSVQEILRIFRIGIEEENRVLKTW